MHRMLFTQSIDLIPLVADLYREWHQQRGINDNHLLVESFTLIAPHRAIRGGAVPFWMIFNTQMAAAALAAYLGRAEPFERIYMVLFSRGVNSAGVTPIDN